MKKIISLLLCLAMLAGSVCALASCNFEKNPGKEKISVAMSPDFAPMEFYDLSKQGNEAIVGFDVLLANYIAKELNKELVIKPMNFDACMSAVQAGSADLAISGFSWTAARAENFLITDYYVAGENETEQVVITTKANAGAFTTTASFAGKKVGAQGGSLQELLVNEQLVTAGATIVKYTSTNEALTALKTGLIDAFAVAKGNGEAFISQNPDTIDYSGFEFEVDEKYKNNVILVNKNNQALCDQVNAVLAKAMAAGVYDAWYNACQTYAGISSVDENGYDENGNKIFGEDENGNPITSQDPVAADQEKKVAYESFYNQYKN